MAEELVFLWKNCLEVSRTRSSKRKLQAEWRKIKVAERPSLELLTEALQAWKLTSKWSEGFAEGIHIWTKDRQWENIPTALPDPKPDQSKADIGGRTMSVTKLSDIQPSPETEPDDEPPF